MIAVDKDVPMPDRAFGRAGNGSKPKYPWADLEIGDSFFVFGIKQKALSSNGYIQTKKTGHKYTTAKVDGGVRVWRVA